MAKKNLVPSPISKQAALLARLQENDKSVASASSFMHGWRYIDFVNPQARLPCLTLEWLLGARGFLAGRIAQLRAKYSKGKSSFMYLQYAAAQIMSQAFCLHIETEGAGAPADYIASLGCNPNDLMVAEIPSLEDCLAKVDEIICEVRGGFGGGVNATGQHVKTKFADPIDPNMENPIVIGIDSLSSLGAASGVNMDIADAGATSALSYHTRKLREYFRDRVGRFRDTQTLLLLTSHETAAIKIGGGPGFGKKPGGDKSSLAQEAIGIHATYGMDFDASKWMDNNKGIQVGDIITIDTFKNKISPRYRRVQLFLETGKGFNLIKTDTQFLLEHPASPLGPDASGEKQVQRTSAGVKCPLLSDKTFRSDEDFLRAFYANTDMVMSMREKMRIRGCGFAFETDYQTKLDEMEAATQASTTEDSLSDAQAQLNKFNVSTDN